MPIHRSSRFKAALVMGLAASVTLGVALGQQPGNNEKNAPPASKGKTDKAPKAGLRAPGGAPPKKLRKTIVDPFANANANNNAKQGFDANPSWPFHYRFKYTSTDGTQLAAMYYPAQRGTAPVVMLIHEKSRSMKDFEDGIEDLKDRGLAEYLQGQGYAVLALDLRGHGANPRKELGPRDGAQLVKDLQAAYQFLVDRHNREELNLAKLGVVAVGEGANVAAAWAANDGAVSSEGRISDLGAMVLISPVAEGYGIRLGPALARIAPRMPVLLMTGERDRPSVDPVKESQPVVARQRQSKVEFFPTSLHGYKLLRFQPRVPEAITSFFESTIRKVRNEEWEPRYNLTPVAYGEIQLVRKKAESKKFEPDAKKAEAKEKKADEPKKFEPDGKKAEEPKKDEAKKEDSKKGS